LLKAVLRYDNGTILVIGIAHVPYASVDPRIKHLRAQALYYQNIVEYLKQSEIACDDYVLELVPSPNMLIDNKNISLTLRDYQHKALDNWTKAGKKVLPTGSGKTVIGVKQ
jgi:superfamily II DNA or RNA helicase